MAGLTQLLLWLTISSSLNLIDHGVDYLGLLLIIVYVGAIAIFFLFVVMMINIKHEEINRTKYVPIGLIVALVLMIEIKSHVFSPITSEVSTDISSLNEVSNMKSIGMILYS